MGESKSPTCCACGAAATVFVTFAQSSKCATAAWCEKHAGEAGVFDVQGYTLIDRATTTERRRGESTVRCPACDCSQRDFERQGRFGCPSCYSAFAGLIRPMVQRMHRGVEHRGKIPARGADPASVRHRLAILQQDLSEAVRTEKFEGAAQTRDAIEALKAKLRENSSTPGTSTHPAKSSES